MKQQRVTITRKTVLITQLRPHPKNYRSHPPEQIAKLRASYRRLGQFRSLVALADEQHPGDYLTVAGHGCVQAWGDEGAVTVEIDELAPDTPPDVVEAIMVADNLHSQGAEDDEAALAHLLEAQKNAGYDLASLGSDEETLRQMLQALGDGYLESGEAEDDATGDELPEDVPTRAKLGDIWQLGRHRIACLNSCDPETLRQLIGQEAVHFVWADPPYGIDIVATNVSVGGGEAYDIPFGGVKMRKGDVGGSASHMRKTGKPYLTDTADAKGLRGSDRASKPFGSIADRGSIGGANPPGSKNNLRIAPKIEAGKYFPVIGDDSTQTAVISYRLSAEWFPKAVHVWWGANYYADALPPSSCWIVWDKENTGNFADAELAWCSHKSAVRIFKHMWNGLMKASEKGQRRVHPTQKPIALAEWSFEKYGNEQDVIFDPFLGSGISVIAAEKMSGKRKVYGCELSPEYIDVIVARWEKLTGQTAQLLDRMEAAAHG